MRDTIRDSAIGQWLRLMGGRHLLPYPEEEITFRLQDHFSKDVQSGPQYEPSVWSDNPEAHDVESGHCSSEYEWEDIKLDKNVTLVTWYSNMGNSDPANPHNWSFGKKMWVSGLLLIYTISCYIGTSLYTAAEAEVARVFNVSDTAAALGVSLYVIGYGVGPLLFAPLSEIPTMGRNPSYIYSFIPFVALSLATALVDNFAGFLVLRFLLGFFAAPALANAGASYGDFFGARAMPYVLCFWGGGATLSPTLGPLISGFAVQANGWRWSSWELLWIAGPVLIVVLLALPETSSDTILLRRAERLRRLTGRSDFRSHSEIKQDQMSPSQVAFDALIKPWEINILDPAVLFSTVYTALTYGLFYSFFGTFPLVYHDIYGFNIGEVGLAFLSAMIGLVIGVLIYCSYFYFIGDPQMAKMTEVPPETRLRPGLGATFLIPMGLFIYAWTARESVPWIASLIGVAISMCGIFIIVQCMFIYLPFTYPRYAGSLFAANGFARSAFAAAALLFAKPLTERLGIDGGVSLLAGLMALCTFGMFGLYFGGARLRSRSKFAGL